MRRAQLARLPTQLLPSVARSLAREGVAARRRPAEAVSRLTTRFPSCRKIRVLIRYKGHDGQGKQTGAGCTHTAVYKLCATALHYTTRQLDDAWRLDELKPIRQIVLSLDYAQQKLGNGSCSTPITMDE